MDIVIIGAGAMGCLFGALLAPYAKVSLYCRQERLARLLRVRGIVYQAIDGSIYQQPVQTISNLDTAQRHCFDYAIICTKAHAGTEAGIIAQALLRKEGLALTLQNGLGNRERIGEHVGEERIMVGITAQAATRLDAGEVRHAGAGRTFLAPAGNAQRRHSLVLATLFNEAGIDTMVEDDPEALIWSKLIVNAGINALAAIMRVPNGALANDPACRAIMAKAVAEAVQVAEALDIKLPYDHPFKYVLEVCEQTEANRASTLQDILRRAPTEIEVINGAIARLGELHQVPTPVNTMLSQLIQALEATADRRVA
ncbi:MAG: 2-dehydropantoate 2-reductase [bacterium]|nr:2-dehydropantoate 2-reductase [bacterium]